MIVGLDSSDVDMTEVPVVWYFIDPDGRCASQDFATVPAALQAMVERTLTVFRDGI